MRSSIALLCGCLLLGGSTVAAASPPPPEPAPPRHRASEAMMATGGVVLGLGVGTQMVGFASWYANAMSKRAYPDAKFFSLVPGTEIGIGLGFAIIGTAFISVGVKQHVRWKASLGGQTSARVQWRPVVGLGQLGVIGRF